MAHSLRPGVCTLARRTRRATVLGEPGGGRPNGSGSLRDLDLREPPAETRLFSQAWALEDPDLVLDERSGEG